MKCIHVNIRSATFIVLSVLLNGVQHSQTGNNHMELSTKEQNQKNSSVSVIEDAIIPKNTPNSLQCPIDVNCTSLHPPCIDCNFNMSCEYGMEMRTVCTVKSFVVCKGARQFERSLICRYCYQTETWEHTCALSANCNSVATPRSFYKANCSVKDEILCLGQRTFPKNVICNWTGGYRWSTALALSITLGGFGADRFYLGHWQEGIGKLFSFGGLGVWTLIDVILISLHYLGPADGSLYI